MVNNFLENEFFIRKKLEKYLFLRQVNTILMYVFIIFLFHLGNMHIIDSGILLNKMPCVVIKLI